ncbi:hypothetical protein E2542_SST08536 [Spatholobus suberectus]|nr:hypothetical protein E2542_SST08536 [Spatholobus suberectus]
MRQRCCSYVVANHETTILHNIPTATHGRTGAKTGCQRIDWSHIVPHNNAEALWQSALPQLKMLIESNVCKAKVTLLVLIKSIVIVDSTTSCTMTNWLVSCLVEFLDN